MSKLNPQKASAYVGPGVLRKGGKITPVPNGPLIKKKGPFKGSTLKVGGVIKKAQDGFNKIKPGTKQTTPKFRVPESRFVITNDTTKVKPTRWVNNPMPPDDDDNPFKVVKDVLRKKDMTNKKTGGPVKKAKAGAMIKRADGSMSRRGLWDNIRANKGSGKKPTKQMLVQEKKIKAKSKK